MRWFLARPDPVSEQTRYAWPSRAQVTSIYVVPSESRSDMNSASLPNAHKSADVLGRLMHTGNLTDLGVEWTLTLRPLQSISRVQ